MNPEVSTPAPDLVTLSVFCDEEIAADRADLTVTVRGTSFFGGTAALTKAREVAQLVAELKAAGLTDADIRLQSVTAESTGGALSKSQARYVLTVQCAPLSLFGDVLGAITGMKEAELAHVAWKYTDETARRDALLDEALRRLSDKGRRVAQALGVILIGVRSFQESPQPRESDSEMSPQMYGGSSDAMELRQGFARSRRQMTSDDLAMDVSHSKRIAVGVTVEYRVSPITTALGSAL